MGASSSANHTTHWTTQPVSGAGWGIADNKNHWGGWAKEVADVEEEQDDEDDSSQYQQRQEDEEAIKVGTWTRKNKSKAVVGGRSRPCQKQHPETCGLFSRGSIVTMARTTGRLANLL